MYVTSYKKKGEMFWNFQWEDTDANIQPLSIKSGLMSSFKSNNDSVQVIQQEKSMLGIGQIQNIVYKRECPQSLAKKYGTLWSKHFNSIPNIVSHSRNTEKENERLEKVHNQAFLYFLHDMIKQQ